jgi:signal transduction histidine kinase
VAAGVAVIGAAAAAAGAVALAHGEARGQSTALAATGIVAGCAFVAAGIVAFLRQSANRIAVLMMASGFLLFANSLAQANSALPFTAGLIVGPLAAAVLGHLVLAFPDGRLHSRGERLAVAAAYIVGTVVQVAMMMFMGPEQLNGCPCPDNLLLVRDNQAVHGALMSGQQVAGVAVGVWIGVLLERRWRGASRPLRRAILPLLAAGAVTILLFLLATIASDPAPALARGLEAADRVALAIVPVAYLLGLFNARLARAGVSDLVVELSRMPGPGGLRDALSRALGDPSLELAYWLPESGTYVGIDGQPIDVHADEGRMVSVLERGGRRVAAMVHDPALGENPQLLDAVSAAAGLALENERLQADLRAQLEELRESRARIVAAGDSARRRLERNLHDGAQQRLVALAVGLRIAESTLRTDPAAGASLLASAQEELALALSELREIARGLHPAILNQGLAAALGAVAARSPVPVDLEVEIDERPPDPVAATAYYVVSEALTNTARYAEASRATVHVAREADHLRVEIADDGVGGAGLDAGSGLQGLRDRVEGIGGRLELDSPPGSGTRIAVHLPLAM